ncbi:MAG: methyltransferase domain-containing protein [Bacteroidetes bacterium]|nr:methyltransferase domain-containing protein [Bacteroidota bacterium]
MLTPEQFYDALAADYDAMTQFDQRLEKQLALFAKIGRLPGHAVDMGCGTGVHAVALAQLGWDVTAVDVSAEMLERARGHAKRHGRDIRFLQGDFLQPLPVASTELLLCLGNSLPHLPSREALGNVLTYWRTLLATKGRVIIQLLNYERILAEQERIVNIRRERERIIVRFYDFLPDALQFNILTIIERTSSPEHSLRSTRLIPFTGADIESAAADAGFSECQIAASIEGTPVEAASTDIAVILA